MDREKLSEKITFLKDDICTECGEAWASEYHVSDVCVTPIEEDPLAMR